MSKYTVEQIKLGKSGKSILAKEMYCVCVGGTIIYVANSYEEAIGICGTMNALNEKKESDKLHELFEKLESANNDLKRYLEEKKLWKINHELEQELPKPDESEPKG